MGVPSISVGRAIARGLLYVNGPVVLLIFGPSGICFLEHVRLAAILGSDLKAIVLVGTVFLGGVVAAWLWWSYAVPRWRIWAYERVDDLPNLKRRAVEVGLTWPDGHFFEKTEFKSRSQIQRQQELEAEKGDFNG